CLRRLFPQLPSHISCLLSHVATNPPFSSFFFSCYSYHRDLHSFPTRRSSDLPCRARHRSALPTPDTRGPPNSRRTGAAAPAPREIGRAHVLTPVTLESRMPSSA